MAVDNLNFSFFSFHLLTFLPFPLQPNLSTLTKQATAAMFRSVRDNVSVYDSPWNYGANPDLEPRDMEAKVALLKVTIGVPHPHPLYI